jgi:hypothetical protein
MNETEIKWISHKTPGTAICVAGTVMTINIPSVAHFEIGSPTTTSNNIVIPASFLDENLVERRTKPGDSIWLQFWNKAEFVLLQNYTSEGCAAYPVVIGGKRVIAECDDQGYALNGPILRRSSPQPPSKTRMRSSPSGRTRKTKPHDGRFTTARDERRHSTTTRLLGAAAYLLQNLRPKLLPADLNKFQKLVRLFATDVKFWGEQAEGL